MNLFILNENGRIDLNKVEIQLYKEFKEIVHRDKGSKGDNDGRKKYRAIKELTYVYHMCDYRSFCRELDESEVQVRAIEESGLSDEKFNPKDEVILAAIEKYKLLQNTRSVRQLEATRKAIDATIRFCEDFEPTDISMAKAALTLPAEVAKANKGMKELEDQVKREFTEEPELKGGDIKGYTEDGW